MINEIQFGYATQEEAEALQKNIVEKTELVQLVDVLANDNQPLGYFVKVYQKPWVRLTDAEISDIEDEELSLTSLETFSFARAIEAKLKEKNQ